VLDISFASVPPQIRELRVRADAGQDARDVWSMVMLVLAGGA